MGEQRQGRRPRRALAAALFITLAWPATALAQDAIDIDSSFTAFAPELAPLPDVIEANPAARSEPPSVLLVDPRLSDRPNELYCTNVAADQQNAMPNLRALRRTVSSGTGAINATYTSNASELDGGEQDILTTTTLRLERVRRTREGLCRRVPTPAGEVTAFEPQRAYTLYANSLNLAFRDDNAADASRFTLGGNISWALDDGRADNRERYRTRASVSLDNNVTYLGLYQDWISTTHDLRAGVSHILSRPANGTWTVKGAVGRVFSNPERGSYNLATVSLTRDMQLNDDWALSFSGSVTYNQFADAEPEDFDDTRYRLGMTVTRTIATDVAVEATINLDARTSDIPIREYDAISLPLAFRVVRRF